MAATRLMDEHQGEAGLPHGTSFTDDRTAEQLVGACRSGDPTAWESLIRRYQRLIYTVPLRFGLDEDEAADVFQHTCVRLFEHIGDLENPQRLDAWLVSTSRHLALDLLRRRRRQATPDAVEEVADEAQRLDQRLEGLEEQQRIRRALIRLDPRCRALLYHLFYDPEEPSYLEIAAALGMKQGSIGPVRARCFSRLKVLLQEEDS